MNQQTSLGAPFWPSRIFPHMFSTCSQLQAPIHRQKKVAAPFTIQMCEPGRGDPEPVLDQNP